MTPQELFQAQLPQQRLTVLDDGSRLQLVIAGTVLRSATAKRAHGRGINCPSTSRPLPCRKQTEQAAAITNGLLNIAMQFITGICQ